MKRQRGRNRNSNNNNNNKNNNPNRSLDSNGPDVKVRGSASHIYEKYVTLARDATSSGHRVKAENYLQHAEHYLRIVTAQETAKTAAREEREAREAAQQANQADKATEGDSDENRNNRRNQNRNRHNRNDSQAEAKPDNNSEADKPDASAEKQKRQPRRAKVEKEPDGLELVEPKTSEPVAASNSAVDSPQTVRDAPHNNSAVDDAVQATPKRRRRAPARKKPADSVSDTADAAE